MCLTPINVKNKRMSNTDYAYNTVPCGKCPACRRKRCNAWVFRLMQESKLHKTAYFVTLTYDNDNIRRTRRRYPTLSKRDLQLYFKRLRKSQPDEPVRYYACGEYGSRTQRPHYHVIIFGARLDNIPAAWPHGHVHIGEVNEKTIAYTVKYLDKGKQIPMHANDDRLPEFALMSKKMGLNYLTPEVIRYHRSNKSNTVTLPGGIKQSMPRYYRDKIYPDRADGTKDPIRLQINAKLQKKFSEAFEAGVKKAGDVFMYYRNSHESVKSELQKFSSNLKKRNKL